MLVKSTFELFSKFFDQPPSVPGSFELLRGKRFLNVHPFFEKCKPGFQEFYVFSRKGPPGGRDRPRHLSPRRSMNTMNAVNTVPGSFTAARYSRRVTPAPRPQTGNRPGGPNLVFMAEFSRSRLKKQSNRCRLRGVTFSKRENSLLFAFFAGAAPGTARKTK